MKKLLIILTIFLISCQGNDHEVRVSPDGKDSVVYVQYRDNDGNTQNFWMNYMMFQLLMNRGGYDNVYDYHRTHTFNDTRRYDNYIRRNYDYTTSNTTIPKSNSSPNRNSYSPSKSSPSPSRSYSTPSRSYSSPSRSYSSPIRSYSSPSRSISSPSRR